MSKIARLIYHLPQDSEYTIDLAKDLSITRRKLHRQKMTYTVLGGQIKESANNSFYFKTAPHCWTTNVAIRRAFNIWRKANREAYKKSDITAPKWSDFKLRLDATHTSNLTPMYDVTEDGTTVNKPYQEGEWNYSTLVQAKLIDPDNDGGLEFDADADSWDMQIVGTHTGSGEIATDHDSSQKFYQNLTRVGVINSWYYSRSTPQTADPNNAPSGPGGLHGVRTDPLSNLFDVQDDDSEMISVIESENDQAPYDYYNVPGMNAGELQLVAFVDNSAGEPDVVNVPGFQAPCGLIRVKPTERASGAILMLDVLVEGERI